MAMTLVHLGAAALWGLAVFLLVRRVKAGQVIVGVLAAGYIALNVLAMDSIFTIMLHFVVLDQGWGQGFLGLLFGDESGTRITGAGAVLAGLLLILVLVSVVKGRTQGSGAGRVPDGFGGQAPGQTPSAPPQPYR
ncbi:hypothetical protein [Nocardia sp. SSK8]|uniref:hypothetical protein n=1 Tax=Nocardia sp. SSK8 TaxID=3120154 RepID=UPI00300A9286